MIDTKQPVYVQAGWLHTHPTEAPQGELVPLHESLKPADIRDGWQQEPVFRMQEQATKAQLAGEYPALPEWSKMDNLGGLVPSEIRQELRAYVDADRAMRAQAAPQPAASQGEAAERKAFESIFKPDSGVTFDRDKYGFYKGFFVSEAWKVWQARAALAIQEAPVAQVDASYKSDLSNKLFCDLKTDQEKANFFLSGRGYETGVISSSIQNDVAMAYHRCAEYQKATCHAAYGDTEDAARYRFLAGYCRSTSEHWGGRWSIIVDGPAPKSHDSEDDFDEAVDAARKQGDSHD